MWEGRPYCQNPAANLFLIEFHFLHRILCPGAVLSKPHPCSLLGNLDPQVVVVFDSRLTFPVQLFRIALGRGVCLIILFSSATPQNQIPYLVNLV